jgi:pilus assembly protein CpaE
MSDTSTSSVFSTISALLIVPDQARRESLESVLAGLQFTVARALEAYPAENNVPSVVPSESHVVIVDLDTDVNRALHVIESICSHNPLVAVIAYSSQNDVSLMRRSMQAGAREFLVDPLQSETLREALVRTSARRPNQVREPGKLLAVAPSKGGIGATTVATNFALALVKESSARVVIVDMDVQLGDVALGLGLRAGFSVVDALMNPARLDKDFLSSLLLKHSSGLSVLASPEDFNYFSFPRGVEASARLFRILRQEFDYVVVDVGTIHGDIQDAIFAMSEKIYVVVGMTFPSLRNGHRLISFLLARSMNRQLEVVLNRFNSRHGAIDEQSATKALGRPISWRIPNGYAAARAAEDSGIPLSMSDSPITRAFAQMARSACGKPPGDASKASGLFSFFNSKAPPAPVDA